MRWWASAPFVLGVLLGFAGWESACSLKVDESLVDGPFAPDASRDASDAGSTTPACTTDAECVSSDPCLTARCDVALGQCAFSVCPTEDPCTVSACDRAAGACSAPKAHKFAVSAFKLEDQITCQGCAAAVHPYLFVQTPSSLFAVDVSDPTALTPTHKRVPLPFEVSAMERVGRRLFFFGAIVGLSSTKKLQVAWLDVPSNPHAPFEVRTDTIPASTSNFQVVRTFARSANDLLLVASNGRVLASTVPRDTRITPAVLNSPGFPANANFVASSGGRLVAFRAAGDGLLHASLQLEPGTPNSSNTGENQLPELGPVLRTKLDVGPDGSLLVGVESRTLSDAGLGGTTSLRTAWILANAQAQAFSSQGAVETERYVVPLETGAVSMGGVAITAPDYAIALGASPETIGQTSVRALQRSGEQITVLPQRAVLSFAPGLVTTTGADGYAFVVVPDATDSSTVYVFAPTCGS